MTRPDPTHDARRRWNSRHAERTPSTEPAAFLVQQAEVLPRSGRALDVGGGTGRNAIWLARHGLAVTLVDVSDEACQRAAAAADAAQVPLDVIQRDVSLDGLPPGRWDVVLFHHFLAREAWPAAVEALAPGGILMICQPTARNLERHERPSRRWLLEPGELGVAVLTSPGVEVVAAAEGWTDEGRHEASAVVRRVVAA